MRLFSLMISVLTLAGCAAQQVAGPSPEYAPVVPQPKIASSVPTGSIFSPSNADSWFGEKKTYQVGDVITVLLSESMNGSASATNEASRETSTDVLTAAQIARIGSPGGLLLDSQNGTPIDTTVSSSGSGATGQSASLTGTMTAQVLEVFPNGNLMIRGEKIVNFSTGSEVIQVKGIIRPQDIQPDNTVQSKRIASAQISYKGTGQNANASRTPWGTNLLMAIWPF
ncbi:MAG: flagellar basal body L-ring protein FlgH [Gammaproteobacteria bacterium]|jgi:flagellar L-ring protein precursor FlgH